MYEARILNAPFVKNVSASPHEEEVIIPSGEILKLLSFEQN